MGNPNLIIGTRGSDLALWQANFVMRALEKSGYPCKLHIIKTQGDIIQHLSFDKMEGKGFFTKEIEEALLQKTIDIAVHSHKDLETEQPEGLCIAAVSERAQPEDLLILRREQSDSTQPYNLRPGAVIGTSSLRRKMLVELFMPGMQVKDLRGNVPTRLQKLREGLYDAVIMAAAGINRLNLDLSEFEIYALPCRQFIPAAAQGVLALQCRHDHTEALEALKKLNTPEVEPVVWLEREILKRLEGGCRLPIGVYTTVHNGIFDVHASYAETDQSLPVRIHLQGTDAGALARTAVEKLKTKRKFSVAVSRSEAESKLFSRLLSANGHTLKHYALTRYENIPFEKVPECDWIFFSSRQCVHHFLMNKPVLPPGVKFGSIGGATAEALRQQGLHAEFTGDGPDTKAIGRDFARLAGNARILFPQSTGSYRTVQKEFSDQSNLIDLIVYDTLPVEDITIEPTDIAVLTSPTNAILYLRALGSGKKPVFIAIGRSTADVLQQHGITDYMLPWNTSEIALADAVMSV